MSNVISDLLSSKKFVVLLLAVIGSAISAVTDTISWADALQAMLAAVGVYIGAQGFSDGMSGGMTSSQKDTPAAPGGVIGGVPKKD